MFRLKSILFLLSAFAVVLSGCIGPATSGIGSLRITVLGADGAPLAGAKVASEIEPQGQPKVTGLTGSDGVVSYRDIKAGSYSFYTSRFDYQPKQFSVIVPAGRTTELTLRLDKTLLGQNLSH